MHKFLLMFVCVIAFGLSACGQEEPENYGGIPKETLDKVAKDAEAATEEAKEKIDAALKNIE
jgi:hypothetical protein